MSLKSKLSKAVEEEGINPVTDEALAEAGSEETLDNNQPNGGDYADEANEELDTVDQQGDEGDSEGTGDDTAGQESESDGDGQESDQLELTEEEQAILDGEEGKGMVNVPTSLLKKLRKQKQEAEQTAKAQEQRYIEQLQAQNQQKDQFINGMQQPQQEAPVAVPEPDRELEPEMWAAWKADQTHAMVQGLAPTIQDMQQRSMVDAAQRGFTQLETQYESQSPGYLAKKEKFIQQEIQSQRILNPNASEAQLRESLNNDILMQASNIANNGLNPAETFDKLMNARGIKADEPVKKEIKPNIKAVAKNSSKSKSLSGAGVKSDVNAGGMPTAEDFLAMTDMQVRDLEEKMGRKKFDRYIKDISEV